MIPPDLTAWTAAVADTPQGARVATGLALAAAFLHALFGALQKGRFDPWVARAAMDAWYGLIALPVALFVAPWPEPALWPVLAGVLAIHIPYKIAQARAYGLGAYTVVYPVSRGTAPLFTVLAATALFRERYTLAQWGGVVLLVGAILSLAAVNLRRTGTGRVTAVPALAWAALTGAMVAAYTTYDAWGIRQAAHPLTFLAWFFLLDSLFMPLVAARRLAAVPRDRRAALAGRGLLGALVAIASFGAIMMATRIDDLGRVAVLRETSTVFAALVGRIVLGEKTGPLRTALMALIALGAIVVEFGGGGGDAPRDEDPP